MAENSGISHEYESYELEMTFRGLLLPDEELIWCARSHKKINLFVLSLMWNFGISYVVVGVFFIILAVREKRPASDMILHCSVMSLFIITGLVYLIKTIKSRKRRIKKGKYALTDKRVIAITGKNVSSIDLTEICRISIEKTAPAVGHITIYRASGPFGGSSVGAVFCSIKGPLHIDDIIRKQIETARKKAGLPEIEIEGQPFRQMTAGM